MDGTAYPIGGGDTGQGNWQNSDRFEKHLLECNVLSETQIAKAVGGSFASRSFNGAICRWTVSGSNTTAVTFNWFEWGSMAVEQRTAKKLGYTTENIKIADTYTAFTQRDPKRPAMCGVTSKAPGRGVYTWWVEPRVASGDSCAAAIKLMTLVLRGSA
ncbi:hypothetical protein GOEFS_038_00190 [Gordonia effusa NBRC 100432]|uniref:DUF3558 domain-containing protein n=1 Tax=Gordonia effusa NBRC 100432 TaxID=1077974 RepID=H0QY51_9ACTN|nr:hypothetical protein GOEFS_038_00190 [Gordonia effusa NBRC 100432]